jgi:hypothetical protein
LIHFAAAIQTIHQNMTPNLEADPPEWLINYQPENPKKSRPRRPTIQSRTEMFPTGDTLMDTARNAIWEAWQIGLQNSGHSVYPKVPLLDREPMEPEI